MTLRSVTSGTFGNSAKKVLVRKLRRFLQPLHRLKNIDVNWYQRKSFTLQNQTTESVELSICQWFVNFDISSVRISKTTFPLSFRLGQGDMRLIQVSWCCIFNSKVNGALKCYLLKSFFISAQ